MANVYTRIGYIKGATGATGAQGAKGDTGDAATIEVGSVTTVPYGQTANVVNSGTEQAAVFDFTIPQGRPGQQVTEMDNLLLNSITTSAAEFPLPAVGETGKVLWGKVVKWFSDMAALVATKLNAANVVNNLTTTASGYALDARQGKALHNENYYSSGDTIALSDATYAGMSNASGNSISLFIPLPKQVTGTLAVSVNSVTINWVRADGQTYPGTLAVTQGRAGNINLPGTLNISIDGTFPTIKMMGVNFRANFTVI